MDESVNGASLAMGLMVVEAERWGGHRKNHPIHIFMYA